MRCTNLHGNAFFNWRWDCGRHNGEYKQADPEYLSGALRHLVTSHNLTSSSSFNWYMALIANVGKQFSE